MNKHIFPIILSIIFFAALIGLQGCKTKRALIKKPLKEQGESYLLEKMASNELDFDWFSARCAVTVINDKKTKTDLRGQLRIQKDSVIWMSLSPALGIEVARLMITQDSIWFINRIDKNYFKGDYDFINSFFQTTVDFDILPALFLGHDMNHSTTKTIILELASMLWITGFRQHAGLKRKDCFRMRSLPIFWFKISGLIRITIKLLK